MPSGVLAQTVSTLDVGAGNVNYDGAAELSVYSITPRFSINRELTTVVVAATFSRFDDEGWGSRALAASRRRPMYFFKYASLSILIGTPLRSIFISTCTKLHSTSHILVSP